MRGLGTLLPAFAPLGAPPFPIGSLPHSFLVGSNGGGYTGAVWPGEASAGNSGNVDALGALPAGAALNGFATVSFAAGRFLQAVLASNHATVKQLSAIVDLNATSMWALVKVTAIAGGAGTGFDSSLMGGNVPRQAMLLGGAANDKYEAQKYFSVIAPQSMVGIINTWACLQYRYNFNSVGGLGTVEARIGGGGWAAQGFAGGYFVDPTDSFIVGANNNGLSFTGLLAAAGVSQTSFADADFDHIRSALSAKFAVTV